MTLRPLTIREQKLRKERLGWIIGWIIIGITVILTVWMVIFVASLNTPKETWMSNYEASLHRKGPND